MLPVLRALRRVPYFRGRDRAFELLSRTLPGEIVVTVDGLRFAVDTRECTQRDFAVSGHLEPLTAAAVRRLLAPSGTFVDVGAHVGLLAMVAAQAAGPAGRVIAIDPQVENIERIERNAALNGFRNVTTMQIACGSTAGTVALHRQRPTDRSRLSLVAHEPSATAETFEVPLVRLDAAVTGPIDVLKIDVEGFELEVLRGCGERLRDVRAMIAELLPGADHRATLDLLTNYGFELRDVRGALYTSVDALPENNLLATRAL